MKLRALALILVLGLAGCDAAQPAQAAAMKLPAAPGGTKAPAAPKKATAPAPAR